jgi:DNA-binding NtrC family response regulator
MEEQRSEVGLDETLPLGSRSESNEPGRCYLLVFAGGSSSVFPLVANAEVVIGRAENAHLRLHDASVSRVHAKLISSGSEVQLVDMGSHNGSRVNGERVTNQRQLSSGDVINCGQVTLVFHRDGRLPTRRPLLEPAQLKLRLEEEIERSMRYQRPVTVLSIEIGPAPFDRGIVSQTICAQLRLIDAAAWLGEFQLVVVLPETPAEAAQAPSQRLLKNLKELAREVRLGLATCSADGCDLDTLLASARQASRAAANGQIASAADTATTLQLGDQKIVAADPAMTRLYTLIERLAQSDLPVLLCGETGTGKEIAARAMHLWGVRRSRPLVAVNCAAIPETLVESELFGYEKGAFSGADQSKNGLFEQADSGTLFLDEVGELSATTQAKLLRVVETHKLSRLGSTSERAVNVRVVAATNRSLEEEVRKGRFRQDLYYRLSAATVFIPPLRDRVAEIPILARAFLREACMRLGRLPMTISPATMQVLCTHPWPGNVRELKNVTEYVAAAVQESTLEPWMLPERVTLVVTPARRPTPVNGIVISRESAQGNPPRPPSSPGTMLKPDPNALPRNGAPLPIPPPPTAPSVSGNGASGANTNTNTNTNTATAGAAASGNFKNIYDEIRDLERARMSAALDAAEGVQVRAAELIGMPLRTFVTKLKQYNLFTPKVRNRNNG